MFELCGIGNALVDIQIETDDDFLKERGIPKGEMRLVDKEFQDELLSRFSKSQLKMSSGGSAANSVVAFALFGGKAAYLTSLGNDLYGEFYEEELKKIGVDLRAPKLDGAATGKCLVFITPDAERTMLTYLGASALFNKSRLDEEIIANSKYLYLEGYEFSRPESAEAIKIAAETAKKNDRLVALSFSDVFITENFRNETEETAALADLIFCNKAEAMSFAQTDDFKEAEAFFDKNVKNYALTMGAEGSIVSYGGEKFFVPARKVKAVDTTGAGDSYAAGFLYGLSLGLSPRKSAEIAAYVPSLVVSRFGARVDDKEAENVKEFVKSLTDN